MSTAVQTARTLEERIQDKIKADLGSLMTDAELKAIVTNGIRKTLFDRRIVSVKRDWGGHDQREIQPLINELLEPLIKEEMRVFVQQWIADNRDLVKATVLQAFSVAPADIVAAAFNSMFLDALQKSRVNVETSIQNIVERIDRSGI